MLVLLAVVLVLAVVVDVGTELVDVPLQLAGIVASSTWLAAFWPKPREANAFQSVHV